MYYIYTDGSTKNNGKIKNSFSPGGWAYIIVQSDDIVIRKNVGFNEDTTNNRMELTAIIKGLEENIDLLQNNSVCICTDSAYISNCYLQKWYINWEFNDWINSKKEPVKNKDLWEKLIPFFKNPNIDIKKVKGHANNNFNNLVDKMAQEIAAQGGNNVINSNTGIQ